ncbi:MAG: RidA family protein, partial [Chloroflexi bacterium]|nr:RidA family protein [Chloroflexota bacterium]
MPKVYKNYPHLPAPQAPYSQAVRVGDFLFIAGVTAAGPDVVQQARAIMATLRSIVEAEGGTLADVVKMTAYFTEMGRWRDAEAVWAEAFGSRPPANTVIHVVALA